MSLMGKKGVWLAPVEILTLSKQQDEVIQTFFLHQVQNTFLTGNLACNANIQDAVQNRARKKSSEDMCGKVSWEGFLSCQPKDYQSQHYHCCSSAGQQSLKPRRQTRSSHPAPHSQHRLWEKGAIK